MKATKIMKIGKAYQINRLSTSYLFWNFFLQAWLLLSYIYYNFANMGIAFSFIKGKCRASCRYYALSYISSNLHFKQIKYQTSSILFEKIHVNNSVFKNILLSLNLLYTNILL